jgi:hypothetical protein
MLKILNGMFSSCISRLTKIQNFSEIVRSWEKCRTLMRSDFSEKVMKLLSHCRAKDLRGNYSKVTLVIIQRLAPPRPQEPSRRLSRPSRESWPITTVSRISSKMSLNLKQSSRPNKFWKSLMMRRPCSSWWRTPCSSTHSRGMKWMRWSLWPTSCRRPSNMLTIINLRLIPTWPTRIGSRSITSSSTSTTYQWTIYSTRSIRRQSKTPPIGKVSPTTPSTSEGSTWPEPLTASKITNSWSNSWPSTTKMAIAYHVNPSSEGWSSRNITTIRPQAVTKNSNVRSQPWPPSKRGSRPSLNLGSSA